MTTERRVLRTILAYGVYQQPKALLDLHVKALKVASKLLISKLQSLPVAMVEVSNNDAVSSTSPT